MQKLPELASELSSFEAQNLYSQLTQKNHYKRSKTEEFELRIFVIGALEKVSINSEILSEAEWKALRRELPSWGKTSSCYQNRKENKENKGDLVKLAERLSSLSLDDSSTNTAHQKLATLIKTRNIMKFSLCATERYKQGLFTPEEISLLQNMLKEWTVCTLETFTHPVSKDRELLICRGDKVVMDLSKLFQSGVLEDFIDIINDSIKSMNINNTTEWWTLRTRLDRRMKNLLEKLEGSWLGRWRGVPLGQPIDEE